jgi:hypothetical protein
MDTREQEDSLPSTLNFSSSTRNKSLYLSYLKLIPELEESSTLYANEFDSELEWYNSEPLYFESNLKDKLVLIDFWTS